MHSLAMAQSIMQAALSEAEKHEAKRIKEISVKVGEHTFMESDSLQFCLEALSKGTIAEGAQIGIELIGETEHSDGNHELLTDEELVSITLKLE